MISVPVDEPLQLVWFECNDFGNGRRLAELSQGLLQRVAYKAWAAFDGKRWSEREGQSAPARWHTRLRITSTNIGPRQCALAKPS